MNTMDIKGTFIVIEGTDGSGKGTQFQLLADRLAKAGYDVALFDFPQYDKPSSYFVKKYLNGAYGTAGEVGPYTGSLFYALDRFESAKAIREALDAGKVVLSNRFVGSSMAHQGAKFNNPEERRGYYIWLDNLEFEMLRIPRPTVSFVLRVPAAIAQELVDQKGERGYTDKKRDIHEADLNHLERSVNVYDEMCGLFPRDFVQLDCVRSGRMMDVESIQRMLWEKIAPLLPPPSQIEMSAPAIVTPRATDTIEATIVDQADVAQDTAPLANENTETQPASASHINVPTASNLLAQILHSSQLRTLTEQFPHTLLLDQKVNNKYAYYIPENLSTEARGYYQAAIDNIFDTYAYMTQILTEYLTAQDKTPATKRGAAWNTQLRTKVLNVTGAVLPVAAQTSLGISVNDPGLESVVLQLLGSELAELRQAGERILSEARQTMPAFLSHIETSALDGLKRQQVMTTLTRDYLAGNYAAESKPVELVDYWPRNELNLVADMLYEYSDLPLRQIQDMVSNLPYTQKVSAYNMYNTGHTVGDAFRKVRYSWDLITAYEAFRDLQRAGKIKASNLTCQQLTPRYGYDVPKLVDDAGLSDYFEACFDISLRLHSYLQSADHKDEAQYAVLLGHRFRWQMTQDGQATFNFLQKTPEEQEIASYDSLTQDMQARLNEVHPLLATAAKSS